MGKEVNILLKIAKFQKLLFTLTNGISKLYKIFLGCPNSKILLKIRHSMSVRNFGALNEPLNIFTKKFYFNHKVTPHRKRLYGVKIMKILAMKISHLGTFKVVPKLVNSS